MSSQLKIEKPSEERKTFKASVSDISGFSSCRRQWFFNQKWTQHVPPAPLWVGSLVHQGLDAYYKNDRSFEKAHEAINKYYDDETTKIRERLPFFNPEEQLRGHAEDALAYVYNYSLYDREYPLLGEVVAVERPFKIVIPGTSYALSGRIDLVLRSKETGRLIVVDHKTMSSKPSLSGLDVDEQITAYAWACQQLWGEVPDTVVYNVIIKSLPKLPAMLKPGADGKPKISRDRAQATTASLYRATIHDHGLDEADYADILAYYDAIGWDAYFARVESSRTALELASFQRRALVKLRDIKTILDDPFTNAYPSPSSFTCSYCPFLGPCKIMDEGGDWEEIMNNRFVRWEDVKR